MRKEDGFHSAAVLSLRKTARDIFRCCGYEYEDMILADFSQGHLVEPPEMSPPSHGVRRLMERAGLPPRPAAEHPMGRDADLFFAYPAFAQELLTLAAIPDWRSRSGVAICHFQEAWSAEIEQRIKRVRPILNQFDHVYCAMYHTVATLQDLLDVPVSYLPWGVDAETLCPYDDLGRERRARVIDVTGIGKIDGATHDALWQWANRTGRYYNFTTTGLASYSVSHTHHRENLTQILQRSRYFLCYLAKREATGQRKAQREFGLRYFEGLAAGAVVLGDTVEENPGYQEHLDWPGAVVNAPAGATDLPDIIAELEADAAALDRQRRTNVAHCLRRHDHVHRWADVLRKAGLEETPGMRERRRRLDALATAVEQGGCGSSASTGADRRALSEEKAHK